MKESDPLNVLNGQFVTYLDGNGKVVAFQQFIDEKLYKVFMNVLNENDVKKDL